LAYQKLQYLYSYFVKKIIESIALLQQSVDLAIVHLIDDFRLGSSMCRIGFGDQEMTDLFDDKRQICHDMIHPIDALDRRQIGSIKSII
jgi:hypothetical protein